MKLFIVMAALFLAFPAMAQGSPASVFDGQRRGFVIGAGLGLTVAASEPYHSLESTGGFSAHFLLGHGWDESNLAAFELNLALYDQFPSRNDDVEPFGLQGFMGLMWQHYVSRTSPSLLVIVGPGWHFVKENNSGFGVRLGLGAEPIRHFQLTVNTVISRATGYRRPYTSSYVSILLTAIGY